MGLAAVGLSEASTASARARSGVADVKALTAELKTAVQSPTHGKDITIWCGFDQSIEADLRGYIGLFHGHVPSLKLPSLNCAAIEAGEAASANTKR